MNPDYDKQLEAAISRELKAMPELAAPGGLANRVMRVIARSRNSAVGVPGRMPGT